MFFVRFVDGYFQKNSRIRIKVLLSHRQFFPRLFPRRAKKMELLFLFLKDYANDIQ